jgi:hypothetical protein
MSFWIVLCMTMYTWAYAFMLLESVLINFICNCVLCMHEFAFMYDYVDKLFTCKHYNGMNPRHLGTWTFQYWLGHLGTRYWIFRYWPGQFGTWSWMRQYSVVYLVLYSFNITLSWSAIMLLDSVLINFIRNCIYVWMSLLLCMTRYTWAYAFMLLESVLINFICNCVLCMPHSISSNELLNRLLHKKHIQV